MNHVDKPMLQRGFTIVELLFAMSFVSVLLLAIALTVVQVGNIYNRGLIAKDMNQTARDISADFEKTMTASGSFSLQASDHHYVEVTNGSKLIGGRLCIGGYSYIWNSAMALNPASPISSRNKFTNTSPNLPLNTLTLGGTTQYELSLVKIPDSAQTYCTLNAAGKYPDVDASKATELLRSGDHSLMLYYLQVMPQSTGTTDDLSGQQLYTMNLVLGTQDTTATNANDSGVTGTNIACKSPGTPGADLDYCNVKNFTLVLRVASGVN